MIKEQQTSTLPTLISFSGGRSSAYMTKRMMDEGCPNSIVVFANTGKENNAALDFINECDKRWNLNVIWLEYISEKPLYRIVTYETASRNGEPFEALINKRKYLPNVVARFCTGDLKVKTMKRYMRSLGYKKWNVAMGIRYDEPLRWGRYIQNMQKEPFFYVLPLYEWKITKKEVLDYWKTSEFDLQIQDYEGNCDLCFLKGKAKLIRLMKENPAKAAWWIEQENKIHNAGYSSSATFKKSVSYTELFHMSKTTPEIFQEELEYPCHCTID